MLPCVIYSSSSRNNLTRSSVVSLDVMDISGETQRDISHNVVKTRLNSKGEAVANSEISQLGSDVDKMTDVKEDGYCGSCYGGLEPEGGCCNTCESVRQAYVNRGWSFANPDAIDQVCTRKSWETLSHDFTV